ncbi:hypothetical protein ACA910_005041 [Epithemia clementina (nom. ined.)]
MKIYRALWFLAFSLLRSEKQGGGVVASLAVRYPVHFVQHASSSSKQRPWRTYDGTTSSNPYSRRREFFDHFLPWHEVRKDKRVRVWRGNDLGRQQRPGKTSLVTKLLFLNIAAYALQVVTPKFTAWGIKRSELILQGRDLYRLLTPVFLHGGPAHLMMNMYSLNNVGHDVEQLFGPGRFLCTYLLSGIAGNIFSAFQSPNPALGASGAVFGILGAYTVFLARHEWLLGRVGERMSSQLMQTAFLNIALGFANPSIDNWGHIGGFVGGCAMAYYVGPRLYMTSRFDDFDNKFIIDRPILRLPRPIESIPDKIGNIANTISQKVRLDRLLNGGSSSRPWQQRRPPKDRPRWSIKPDR